MNSRVRDFVSASAGTVSLLRFLLYFLRLGTIGFGGPIALAEYMRRDLVERHRWVSRDDYLDGLALAQLAPGPLAAQLAIYLGYVRAGLWGASLVGIAFILPSFLMVVAIAVAYVHCGGLPWMQALSYGIGASVIAIISRSAAKLMRLALKKDPLLWGVFLVLAAPPRSRNGRSCGCSWPGACWYLRYERSRAPGRALRPRDWL
jgi:chromate transporter